jgi:membrane-associated phospholipid phosphatase
VKRRAWREIALGLGTYGLYLAVRRSVLIGGGRAQARDNAERVAATERALGIDVEPQVQRAALRSGPAAHLLNAGYAGANVALSVGWLARLYRRCDVGYPRERRAALAAFAGALPVFLVFPVAPPRTVGSVVDTLRDEGVDLEHPFLVRFYNPVAAMPSHHVALAVVTGVGLAARARTAYGRAWWHAYPPLVGLVVIATGNHFVLDVVAGAALGAAARALTR